MTRAEELGGQQADTESDSDAGDGVLLNFLFHPGYRILAGAFQSVGQVSKFGFQRGEARGQAVAVEIGADLVERLGGAAAEFIPGPIKFRAKPVKFLLHVIEIDSVWVDTSCGHCASPG